MIYPKLDYHFEQEEEKILMSCDDQTRYSFSQMQNNNTENFQ